MADRRTSAESSKVGEEDPFKDIHSKARWDKLDECKSLVEAGCPLDKKNEFGNTPLHMACQNGTYTLYMYTYHLCALLKICDCIYITYILMYSGHIEIAKYFVEKGCNVNEQNVRIVHNISRVCVDSCNII